MFLCPWSATDIARSVPVKLPGLGLVHGVDSSAGLGLGEADGFAAGLGDVGVVQEPVNGRGR